MTLNDLTTVATLTVGLTLVFSILWNRIVPHIGKCLIKTTESIEFPLSKTIQLELQKANRPKRIILKFDHSVGFYSGVISVKDGESEISQHKLPIRPEKRNDIFGSINDDIPRQTDTIIMSLCSYKTDSPLILTFNLDHNVQTPKFRAQLKIVSEEKIEIMVRS